MATYQQLQRWCSPYRLEPYEVAANGSHDLAVRLYEWNTELSADFMGVMHHVEVLFRNRVHEVMTAAHPDNPEPWFKQPGVLIGAKGPFLIAEAEDRIAHDGNEVTAGRIVSSVPFGFWNALFGRAYNQMWISTLHRCFRPHGPGRRGQVVEVLESVRLFRNRLAHHERIFHRDPRARHDELLKLAMWIDPQARDWVLGTSSVLATLARRPN